MKLINVIYFLKHIYSIFVIFYLLCFNIFFFYFIFKEVIYILISYFSLNEIKLGNPGSDKTDFRKEHVRVPSGIQTYSGGNKIAHAPGNFRNAGKKIKPFPILRERLFNN